MVTKKVTVDDTYGAFYPSIPPGWKGTEFRPPKTDEMYLTSGGARYPEVALHDFDEPRIILKRKELSFEVGDCYESDKGIFYRITALEETEPGIIGRVSYQTLSPEGEVRNWGAYENLLKAAFTNRRRATRGEWTEAVIKRCCSFGSCGTGGAA